MPNGQWALSRRLTLRGARSVAVVSPAVSGGVTGLAGAAPGGSAGPSCTS